MGFFDSLFGRQKPIPASPDKLFAISTAQVALEAEQSLTPKGVAAMCFKKIASGPFQQLQRDLDQLLRLSDAHDPAADNVSYRPYDDALGYSWLIFAGSDFQSLVTTVHVASRTLLDQGYGSQLLFTIFDFVAAQGAHVYWIYNYKRGLFYPFVPQNDSHDTLRRRNNPEELRLATAMKNELPMENEIERWYPVWDLPF
jgi:hypothetical protein